MHISDMVSDLRHAFRSFVRHPGFTLSAVLTIALGIGANTGVFSIADEIFLRPLPVPDAGRMAAVYSFNRRTNAWLSTSYPDYEDLKRRNHSFADLSAYVRIPLTLESDGRTERIPAEAVTSNYFQMLRLPPLLGRAFDSSDTGSVVAPPAMISERLWAAAFSRDPAVIGKTIMLSGHAAVIQGIVPARYQGANLNWSDAPDLWLPLELLPTVIPRFSAIDILRQRDMRWLVMLGRLRRGETVERAQAELQTLASGIAAEQPASRDITARVFSANNAKFWPAYRRSVAMSLAGFAIVSCMVLLLACANICNLLLARTLERRGEIAIRIALGVGRGRLIRQLLTENIALIVPGFPLAVFFAAVFGRILARFPNGLGISLALRPSIDLRMIAFCAVISLAAAILSGLIPAVKATNSQVASVLNESGRSLSGAGVGAVRNGLVIMQVALSMILLAGGGLFVRSLERAYSTNPGFETHHIISAGFDALAAQTPRLQTKEARAQKLRRLTRQLSEIPGVESAAVVSDLPLSGIHATLQIRAASSGAFPAKYVSVSPGFFKVFRTPMAAGRVFTENDGPNADRAVIVNQTLGRQLWGAGDPLGRAVSVKQGKSWTRAIVVGLARDDRYGSVWNAPEPYVWLAAAQWPMPPGYIALRVRAQTGDMGAVLREWWGRIEPHAPLFDVRTMDDRLNLSLAPQRLAAAILNSFGGVAAALAAAGLYGLLAWSAIQRRREIAIRRALGASRLSIFLTVGVGAASVVLAGIAIGAALSVACIRLIASQIRGVSPYDGATFAIVAVLMLLVSLAAIFPPMLRATRENCVQALRG
ncbi:MAG TPA: ADOP family duplicated permease [Bryobacteraceae bacterium]|nr:ADOP family duplicated permease [Bryobacteraceae bacterium]